MYGQHDTGIAIQGVGVSPSPPLPVPKWRIGIGKNTDCQYGGLSSFTLGIHGPSKPRVMIQAGGTDLYLGVFANFSPRSALSPTLLFCDSARK